MILFVDDMEIRYQAFCREYPNYVIEFAQTIESAKEKMLENVYEQVFLDHDMSDEDYGDLQREGTGQILAMWMVEQKEKLNDPSIIIHSHNPYGAQAMYNILRHHFTDVVEVRFSWLI